MAVDAMCDCLVATAFRLAQFLTAYWLYERLMHWVWPCRNAPFPQDKMIRPEDIAQAALLPFRMSPKACPTDIVVQPSHKLA